jgi:DNA-binding GntR family transcriptional regulator
LSAAFGQALNPPLRGDKACEWHLAEWVWPMSFEPPSTKTNHVYRLIKEDILTGRLGAGVRLRLTELAANYNISEMPVREALRMLQQAGLVVFESHRGATVAELSLQELLQVIETRTHLELLAIRLAAPHHDKESLDKLESLHQQMCSEVSSTRYFSLNHRFHVELYRPCKNDFLKQEIDRLWERAWSRWSKSLFELRPGRVPVANEEHLRIIEALRYNNVEDAEKAARAHRESTLAAWRSFEKSQSVDPKTVGYAFSPKPKSVADKGQRGLRGRAQQKPT